MALLIQPTDRSFKPLPLPGDVEHHHLAEVALACGLALAMLCGCDTTDGKGYGEVSLYDQPVVCDPLAETCRTPGGAAAPFVQHQAIVFLSRGASQYGKNAGIYMHMEIWRSSDTVGVLELDLPTGSGVSGRAHAPLVSYFEYRGNSRVFLSTRARGKVEVPLDAACSCQDGRLELVLTDPGPDNTLDTADDQVRRLSRGLFGSAATTCHRPKMMEVKLDREVEVAGLVNCAADTGSSGSGYGSTGRDYYDYDHSGGCTAPDDSSGGCEGDTYDDGYGDSYDSDTGCEGDSSDSSSDYDSGGCEGDSSSSDYDSGGCEGDSSSSSSSSSCEGDAYAATTHRQRRPVPLARKIQRALGLTFPLACAMATILTHRQRRRRKRQGSVAK